MSSWRKWIISFFIVALPASSMAGLQFDVHCQNHAQEADAVSQTTRGHCSNTENTQASDTVSKQSQRQCDCSGDIECVSAGVSLVAIATNSKALFIHNNEQIIDYSSNRFTSLIPLPLFRPPISNS